MIENVILSVFMVSLWLVGILTGRLWEKSEAKSRSFQKAKRGSDD